MQARVRVLRCCERVDGSPPEPGFVTQRTFTIVGDNAALPLSGAEERGDSKYSK
jgi:hypothetical protein